MVACFLGTATTGYVISAGLGAEALRREAEKQLAIVMQGSVHIARARISIRGGLFIEGERVGVYPRTPVPRSPALFASHVSAELDVLALLTGHFRLNSLVLDDAVLEIRRAQGGHWSPPPFEKLAHDDHPQSADDMERSLDLVHAFEAITRTLLEAPLVARRVELRRSRITFYDQAAAGSAEPVEFALYQVDGRLVHHWLSGDADLEIQATLISSGRRGIPLTLEGWQRDGDEMRLALTVGQLPLAYLEPYLTPADRSTRLTGDLSGELAYETRAEERGTVTLTAAIEGFETTIDVRNGHFEIVRPVVQIQATLDVHPGRVRLVEARIDTDGIDLTLEGAVERPLGPAARARLELGVGGLGLEEVREIVRSLPDADSLTLEAILERVEDGRIDRIGASGSARLDEWGPLLLGEADRLPRGFVLRASVSDVRARPGSAGWVSQLGGRLELTGDRLSLRDATGLWNDEPLPKLDLMIDGISNLFRGPEPELISGGHAGALPGLGPLFELVHRDPETSESTGIRTRATLQIGRLEHAILRWPVTNTRVEVEPTDTGLRMVFGNGRWAGVPFDGDAIFTSNEPEALSLNLNVQPDDGGTSVTTAAAGAPEATEAIPWAMGRFEIEAIDDGPLPLRTVDGEFSLRGTRLRLERLHADLLPSGRFRGELELDLADPEQVDTDLRFDLMDGDLDRLGQMVGSPAGYATGKLRLTGRLRGPLRPQTPLLSALRGEVRIEAHEGEIRREELPLVLALAQASAGYNDFAERDAVVYDTIEAQLLFGGGRISTQNFELEGPLRVYASGTIDVARPPFEIFAVVGLFLFRSAGQIMETVPLAKVFLPGSEKGLVGAYFRVTGPFEDPDVQVLAEKSLEEDLPELLAAPYRLLRMILLGRSSRGDGSTSNDSSGERAEEGPR